MVKGKWTGYLREDTEVQWMCPRRFLGLSKRFIDTL
jgi:hypothetical protein